MSKVSDTGFVKCRILLPDSDGLAASYSFAHTVLSIAWRASRALPLIQNMYLLLFMLFVLHTGLACELVNKEDGVLCNSERSCIAPYCRSASRPQGQEAGAWWSLPEH